MIDRVVEFAPSPTLSAPIRLKCLRVQTPLPPREKEFALACVWVCLAWLVVKSKKPR